MKKTIRDALNVPKDQRIAQYIYNQFRDYEQRAEIIIGRGKEAKEQWVQGIDIFYVTDDEFIKKMK